MHGAPDARAPGPRVIWRSADAEAFAPYGELIAPGAAERAINFGTTRRFDDVAHLDVQEQGGRACVALFRTDASTHFAPYPLRAFERHRLAARASSRWGPAAAWRCWRGRRAARRGGHRRLHRRARSGRHLAARGLASPLITIGAADVLVIERQADAEDCEVVMMRTAAQISLHSPGLTGGKPGRANPAIMRPAAVTIFLTRTARHPHPVLFIVMLHAVAASILWGLFPLYFKLLKEIPSISSCTGCSGRACSWWRCWPGAGNGVGGRGRQKAPGGRLPALGAAAVRATGRCMFGPSMPGASSIPAWVTS
jgi:ureidoglycolate lyase